MNDLDLEFLIAQYADGSLASERVAEVEAVLRRDPAARSTLESYRQVDAALSGVGRRDPLPDVRWDALATRIGGQVAMLSVGEVTEAEEEQLSRLAAGELSAAEHATVEAKLAAVPATRVMLADYAALNRAVDAARAEPPATVQWDALASHLSSAVANVEAPRETLKIGYAPAADADRGVWGRIGQVAKQPRWVAAAACLLLAVGVAVRMAVVGGPATPPVAKTVDVESPDAKKIVVDVRAGKDPVPPGAVNVLPVPVNPPLEIRTFADAGGTPTTQGTAGVATVQIGPGGQAGSVIAGGNDVSTRPARSIVFGERMKPATQERESGSIFSH